MLIEMGKLIALFEMLPNARVERPATMTVPRPDAAHYGSRSASNELLGSTFPNPARQDASHYE